MGSNSTPPKTLSDESINRGLVCAHMHFIARTQKILTFMSKTGECLILEPSTCQLLHNNTDCVLEFSASLLGMLPRKPLLKDTERTQQRIDSSPKDAVSGVSDAGHGGRIRHVWCRLFRHP